LEKLVLAHTKELLMWIASHVCEATRFHGITKNELIETRVEVLPLLYTPGSRIPEFRERAEEIETDIGQQSLLVNPVPTNIGILSGVVSNRGISRQ